MVKLHSKKYKAKSTTTLNPKRMSERIHKNQKIKKVVKKSSIVSPPKTLRQFVNQRKNEETTNKVDFFYDLNFKF